MVEKMRNYIIFLFLMLCSAAFPGEMVLNGKELGGIRAIAQHVRDGKIDRIKIVKDKDGKYRLEIVYSSIRYSFCFDINQDRGIESIIQNGIESVASLIKNGNSDGAKEFESINIYKLTALSEVKKEYSGNSYGSGYFTEKLSVEDFISRRKSA